MRPGPRARARPSVPSATISGKVKAWSATMVADLREAWWTPTSLPTWRAAWAERMPDRASVPGDNALLHGGWTVWNHAVRLPVVGLTLGVCALLAMAVFAAGHPARAALLAAVATPFAIPLYLLIG